MTNNYKLTVGLEIHAELNTRTKMFCNSKNPAGSRQDGTDGAGDPPPNTDICPVCMGYPGTLPVINKEAVKSVLKIGVAVGGELADYTEFDRKNYFYPDIPKGYQISQYKRPLVSGGRLAGVELTRIHLEEDTAKSTHDKGDESLVDFNRAGVPLMELVTEPVIGSAEQAAKFAKELQLLLNYLGVAEANMEKGEMRIEANISVSKMTFDTLGTKVEVKNLNSFRSVEKAIKFEYDRQAALIEQGEKVAQETRGWDDARGETFSQRLKEESHDYRYFPDPDLPKLFIREIFDENEFKVLLPELPWQKRKRLLALGISSEHAEVYVTEGEWGKLFEETALNLKDDDLIKLASNFITTDLKKVILTKHLTEMVKMFAAGEISSRAAKDILKIIEEMPLDFARGKTVREIAEEKNLMQISDKETLKKFIKEVLTENIPTESRGSSTKVGKKAPIPFLVGQVIKKSTGRANPAVVEDLLLEMLDS